MTIWRFSNKNQGTPRDFFDGGSATIPRTKWEMRRDTDARRVLTLLADGEPFWTTDTDALYVGDGVTLGGILIGDIAANRFKVKVTSADTTADYLLAKLVAGGGITLTKNNPAGNETITITGKLGDVVGPSSATNDALVRFDTTTGKLVQNGLVTSSDLGELKFVKSIQNSTTTWGGYDDWLDGATYVTTDTVKSATYIGYETLPYVCILGHTANDFNNKPGVGTEWELYWELDTSAVENLYVYGPVIFDAGASFNREGVRDVGHVKFRTQTTNYSGTLRMPETTTENWELLWPIDAPAEAELSLMCDTTDGKLAQLYWGTPGIGAVLGTYGENGQILVTNGVDTIEWQHRPYDLKFFQSGKPTSGQVVYCERLARSVTFADDFAGSYATAETGATLEAVYTISAATGLGSFSSIGTITFAAAGSGGVQAAVIATSGGTVSLSAGDRIKVTAPATVDASLANVSWVLKPSSLVF